MIGRHRVGGARLLLVGTPGSELRMAAGMAREAGADVIIADCAADALEVMRETGADLAMIEAGPDVGSFITSLRLERMTIPVFACGIDASAVLAVAAIRAGARDYIPLPPDRDLIAAAIISVSGGDRLMVGSDPVLERAMGLARNVAHAHVPILISGEAGCGKQLAAWTIHCASGRTGPFVTVDCADIGPNDIESELFGHRQGAFPGAVAHRRGRIIEADAGTLFLRQISALPLPIQSRLVTVLGGYADSPAAHPGGARVIASTCEDLAACVAAGSFRANLLACLALVQIALPPLRQRRGDQAALARHFAARYARLYGLPVPEIAAASLAVLDSHDWPGNIRELEDVMHRAVLLSSDGMAGPAAMVCSDGTALGTGAASKQRSSEPLRGLVGSTVEDVERGLILETLRHCRGNRTTASSILGISVRTMRNKLKAFVEHGTTLEARPRA